MLSRNNSVRLQRGDKLRIGLIPIHGTTVHRYSLKVYYSVGQDATDHLSMALVNTRYHPRCSVGQLFQLTINIVCQERFVEDRKIPLCLKGIFNKVGIA